MSNDQSRELVDAIREASNAGTPLAIRGGNTKVFYGRPQQGAPLDVSGHTGVVNYEPTELVITARSGTRLAEIESVLRDRDQMLAFEPPRFGDNATLGGTVSCGLSGPRRPYAGSVRDFVLGTRVVNGRGEDLRFGGQVMKNVAGYDVSRLMTGAMGTLGLLLEVSLKVLPRPRAECTLVLEKDRGEAAAFHRHWSDRPSPISATCHCGSVLHIRLSGSDKGIAGARKNIGGELLPDDATFWRDLREHEHEFFTGEGRLWRLSMPPAGPEPDFDGPGLTEWGGAQRWFLTDAPAERVRGSASDAGGHATLFRYDDSESEVFEVPPAALWNLHRNTKRAFDPNGIFNPGRMYREL